MMGVFVQLNDKSTNPMSRDHPIGYVIQENGCWDWVGGLNRKGYGSWRDEQNRTRVAHRRLYELTRGSVPRNLQLDHLCRNRKCVNPDHLEIVTPRENIMRGNTLAARHAAKTHCKNGHEFTPENTYPRAKGWRGCRACMKVGSRKLVLRRQALLKRSKTEKIDSTQFIRRAIQRDLAKRTK